MDKGAVILLSFIGISMIVAFMLASDRPLFVRTASLFYWALAALMLWVSVRVLFGGEYGSTPILALVGAILLAWGGSKSGEAALDMWQTAKRLGAKKEHP